MAEDLIQRLHRGDRAALREIYERYRQDLLTLAACLLGDVAAAEDVLHDTFVAFAASAPRLKVRSNLRGYLGAWVANRARDQLRRRNREHHDADRSPAHNGDPLTDLIADEESRRLYGALARLPYEQREVITLHLHGEMTFRQVARQLGVRQNTVQSRYRYGIEKLRSLLKTEKASCVPQKK